MLIITSDVITTVKIFCFFILRELFVSYRQGIIFSGAKITFSLLIYMILSTSRYQPFSLLELPLKDWADKNITGRSGTLIIHSTGNVYPRVRKELLQILVDVNSSAHSFSIFVYYNISSPV